MHNLSRDPVPAPLVFPCRAPPWCSHAGLPPGVPMQGSPLVFPCRAPPWCSRAGLPPVAPVQGSPLVLPCRALVCTIVRWFEAFGCSDVKCPCCFMDVPLLLVLQPPIIGYKTCYSSVLSCMRDTHILPYSCLHV